MPQTFADQFRRPAGESAIVEALGGRSVVLVGMMGAGKSRSAASSARLALPFVDADTEIEAAAGMSIPEIFPVRGEADFRAGEARVVARLLEGGPQVLATGGGAFMNSDTRRLIAQKAFRSGCARIRRADEANQAPERPAAASYRRSRGDPAGADRAALSCYALADLTIDRATCCMT